MSAPIDGLWKCPRCGAQLVTRNLWHSCGSATLQDWKERMGPRARRFFAKFEALIAECGPYHIAPAKTRIAFMARVRFANITALSEQGMSCNFALPEPIHSNRIQRVDQVAPNWFVHKMRIREVADLDQEMAEWLARSYHMMGMQLRLK